MLVKELIEQLKDCHADDEVRVTNYEHHGYRIYAADELEIGLDFVVIDPDLSEWRE